MLKAGGCDELTYVAPLLAGGLVELCLDIVLLVLLVLRHFALSLSFLPAHQQRNNNSDGISRD